ncbi:hypothetical protein C4578_00210 [Candidatus Microgenomates bacterium]|jgi:hypothetical protein|nr:MAG: hypothetical protein C4578_00210 [Candidatus Microgenomates bacterium]
MKKIVSFLLALAVLFSFSNSLFCAQAQGTEEWSDIDQKCVVTADDGTTVATIQGLECLFINITRILTPIFGIALFFMLVVGAFQMITSGGDPKQAQKARQTITYAIFGLIAFVGVWFILKLIYFVTGVDVTKFEIPSL